jgi:hypothetical protein
MRPGNAHRLLGWLLAATLASCEAGDVELDQRCPCGPEIQQVAADCLAAVTAAENAAIAREQVVADDAAAELQEQTDWTNARLHNADAILADQIADVRAATDALRDQLADLRRRVEALEGAP